MKKRNAKCDYIAQRNEDLKKEFIARLGKTDFRRIDDIFPCLAQIPARRFYITEERALILLNQYERNGAWPAAMNKRRIMMMEEIRSRVKALMLKRPKLSLRDAVYEVVNSTAPNYYLTPRSIRTITYASMHSA